MTTIKQFIKRKFKSRHFPENAYFDASQVCEKTKNIELLEDEEVIVTIDNEPGTEIIDCCMFTDKRIIIVKGNAIRSVNYYDIKNVEVPREKIDPNKHYEDRFMNVTDKAKIHLINGGIEEIRLIYGGIYYLVSLSMALRR